jgi:hypothetical protein
MGIEFFYFAEFVKKNNLQHGDLIEKEKLLSFLLFETKHSPHTLRGTIYFFQTLGFIEKKDKSNFIFNKIKFDEFEKRSD